MNEKVIDRELKIGDQTFKLYNLLKYNFGSEFIYYYECEGLVVVYDERFKTWRFGYLEEDQVLFESSDFSSMDKNTWVEALYNNYKALKQKLKKRLAVEKSRIEVLDSLYKIAKEEMDIKDIIE